MTPLSLPLAMLLLMAPPDAATANADAARYAYLAPQIKSLALSLELIDSREIPYVLHRPEEIAADLMTVRTRWQDLHDAPRLIDAKQFPHRDLVAELLTFNRAYREHLGNRQDIDQVNAWVIREAIVQTEKLYDVWDTVRDAKCPYYYVGVRRKALKRLRDELLGPDAYYAGECPPHVPIWFFGRIDP